MVKQTFQFLKENERILICVYSNFRKRQYTGSMATTDDLSDLSNLQ